MNKELWVSVLSLVCMTFFMIFSTVLFFNKSKMVNNTKIYNTEYSDMAFELKDSHTIVQSMDSINTRKDVYKIDLVIKYREESDMNLKIILNYDDIDLNKYENTKVYYSIENQFNQVVKEKQLLEINNDKIIILEDRITYSNINYIYSINIEIEDTYDNNENYNTDELISSMSADLV